MGYYNCTVNYSSAATIPWSVLLLLLLVASTSVEAQSSGVIDVIKLYLEEIGITEALGRAWDDACESESPIKVIIPNGTYLLSKVKLSGPCKAPIELQVNGMLKAPVQTRWLQGGDWVVFSNVDHFTLSGNGIFNGQGKIAWSQNTCNKNKNCHGLPINLRFNFMTNGSVRDVTTLDSKNFHVNVMGCKNFTFQNFTVSAPKESINTDGIHIGRSSNINIIDSTISTGDACISIGDGNQHINITGVTCGPGHGISVGSLGKYPKEEPVSGIFVKNCTISNTTNGVRIKSWPDLCGGTASNMHFEDIIMNNVGNPIIIDQLYCPWNQCTEKSPSKVKISDVSFKNIRGTSATPVAVKLSCSSGNPCEKVVLADIHLKYNGSEGKAKSECNNTKPIISGIFNPPGC